MDLNLKGQRVLVTGGSRGIGLAIAQAFAAEGAMPIMASRDAEQLAVPSSLSLRFRVSGLGFGFRVQGLVVSSHSLRSGQVKFRDWGLVFKGV